MSHNGNSLQPICACFGHPVSGNPTQYVMERAFAHHDLDWRYLTLDVVAADLEAAMAGARAMGFRGVHVLPPHKRHAAPFVDSLTQTAKLARAVNCVRREGDQLVGENTEGEAFGRAMVGRLDTNGLPAVILGAGSIATSIAVQLAGAGCQHIEVVNCSRPNGEQLVDLLNREFPLDPNEGPSPSPDQTTPGQESPGETTNDQATTGQASPLQAAPVQANVEQATSEQPSATSGEDKAAGGPAAEGTPHDESDPDGSGTQAASTLAQPAAPAQSSSQPRASFYEWTDEYDVPSGTGLIINATPIGIEGAQQLPPVALDTLESVTLVVDCTIHPAGSPFLAEAVQRGCQTVNGLDILIQQVAISFSNWTGIDPDLDVIRDAAEEFFGI